MAFIAYKKMIESGLELSKEVVKSLNKMQEQIDDLGKGQIDDHNTIINNIQKEHDLIAEMILKEDLTYDEKMMLLEKMERLQERIDEQVQLKIERTEKEKERKINERNSAIKTTLGIVSGVLPVSKAYNAIKGKITSKKNSKEIENKKEHEQIDINKEEAIDCEPKDLK